MGTFPNSRRRDQPPETPLSNDRQIAAPSVDNCTETVKPGEKGVKETPDAKRLAGKHQNSKMIGANAGQST
jgi:hypothetical protein